MWVGVGREPPAQDVRITVARRVRSHPTTASRPRQPPLFGGQVEPFPAANILDQRLLHRGQPPAGHMSDPTGTLISVA